MYVLITDFREYTILKSIVLMFSTNAFYNLCDCINRYDGAFLNMWTQHDQSLVVACIK